MTDMKRVLKLFIYKISQVENEKLLRNGKFIREYRYKIYF